LKGEPLSTLSKQLPEWEVVDEHHLRRAYAFPDFAKALAFVNRVGEVAEAEMRRTFNLGIGMVVCVPPEAVATALKTLTASGETAYLLGNVAAGDGPPRVEWRDG